MKYITTDGNSACATMAYKLSEICAIYPITPSSPMGEQVEKWSNEGKQNIFGQTLLVKEMQSEGGVSGAIHGSLQTGGLATTFTSSQGLLLMIPNMYKIAGECLPCVFHVAARAVATHALSIFCDHSDVMAVRNTGFNMVCSSSVQDCYDMALFSHILTLKTKLPIVHFFDGFRTSHEIQKISTIEDDDIINIYPFEELKDFKNNCLTPNNPKATGTAQNPDVYFQNRERANSLYDNVLSQAKQVFDDIEKLTGRKYAPFEYYGTKNAEYVVVTMGSSYLTLKNAVDHLSKTGKNVGVINVRMYRPFFAQEFIKTLPKTCKYICALDRTKENGSVGEPLYTDVCTALFENNVNLQVIGGRYGLGGKEFDLSQAVGIFDNLINERKNHFTVGIDDDITHLSLKIPTIDEESNTFNIKMYGFGSDGTVSANKSTIKIIGENTNKYVQGYFEYDSKKSGSLTTSFLRISEKEISMPYKPNKYDFISIHNFNFISKYDLISNLKNNGTVLLNTKLSSEELFNNLPETFVEQLKQKNAKLYTITANKIASDFGLNGKINVIMQTAFFKLSNIIPFENAKQEIKQSITKAYSSKGDDLVDRNTKIVDVVEDNIIEQQFNYTHKKAEKIQEKTGNQFFDEVITKTEKLQGNELPVSTFTPSGEIPTGTSKYLKRGVSTSLPEWIKENCAQCGFCTLACPHAAIRSILAKSEEVKNDNSYADALGMKDYKFKVQVSPMDCTGCGVCSKVCPALKKAIQMVENTKITDKLENEYKNSQNINKCKSIFNKYTAKGLQFFDPYFEYSYACAGCGETPYIKILTQLFGDKMLIANATGCSSIYGGSYPVCPYTKDSNGHGVAWSNSLFEDNAEYGYGMALTEIQNQKAINNLIDKILPTKNEQLNNYLTNWKKNLDCSYEEKQEIILLLNELNNEYSKMLLSYSDSLTKKSIWVVGGDGWAYDIGFGGLDHILNSHENINVLVLDSEVYSNTGGQSSKSSPIASISKFNSNGKTTKKKDLGAMLIANNNCYVASVSLGADFNQTIKALKEAEEFNGPSIVIAYAPCINHGLDMSQSNAHTKLCVECGYWNLYRYNPHNKQPLTLDSGEPTKDYFEFLKTETRYSALEKINPKEANKLFEQSKQNAIERRKFLENILKNQENNA